MRRHKSVPTFIAVAVLFVALSAPAAALPITTPGSWFVQIDSAVTQALTWIGLIEVEQKDVTTNEEREEKGYDRASPVILPNQESV
ncbi:MAG: hypothetical protein AAGD38_07920 [Acidobacteriota bacterium]